MHPEDRVEVARQFAHALDHDDFVTTAKLLTPDCVYTIHEQQIIGPEAICDAYREATKWAHENLDKIEYLSEVTLREDGCCTITFIDLISHGGVKHQHTCQQIVLIKDYLISRIQHVELPGEREAVEKFFTMVGIQQPKQGDE